MVPIHNDGDQKRPKGISKARGEYSHAHTPLPQSRWLGAYCSKENREMKDIGKATEVARKIYESLPI